MLLALGDPTAGANAAIVAGGLMAALGLGLGQRTVTGAGGILATLGMWEHLRQAEVSALEPYAAPVALLLVAAGGSAGARARPARGSPTRPPSGCWAAVRWASAWRVAPVGTRSWPAPSPPWR